MTTPAEIAAGKQTAGFNCNVDLVGQYQGEGASWQLTAWKDCAYFDQRLYLASGSTGMKHPGTVVMDVSNPASPQATTWLAEPAFLDPWESLKVNPARQLLAAAQRPTTGLFGETASRSTTSPPTASTRCSRSPSPFRACLDTPASGHRTATRTT